MLAEARRKSQVAGVQVDWGQADIRDFHLGRTYKLILLGSNTLCHLLDLPSLEACLCCVREHLAEDGRFVLTVSVPDQAVLRRRCDEPQLPAKNEVGNYGFSLAAVDEDGDTRPGICYHLEVQTVVTEPAGAAENPRAFALLPNYPSPFNGNTVIRFSLPVDVQIGLGIYNLSGQRVATLAQRAYPAGSYRVPWYGHDDRGLSLATGPYLYQPRAGHRAETRRLLLLR